VIVKPNAGLPDTEDGRPVYRQEPADFARDQAAAVRLGARAVGGCCGTDARFIAALKAELDSLGGMNAR
jgi:5-methyltetrahydrofolate--homocysteine methyltransferase